MRNLKVGGRGVASSQVVRLALYFAGLLVTLLALTSIGLLFNSDSLSSTAIRSELVAIQEPWSEALIEQLANYRRWLLFHGTETERKLFDGFTTLLLFNVTPPSGSPDESLLGSLLFSAQTGLLRVAFVCVAAARAWLATLLVALYLGFFKYRAYVGEDLLGQTGNGRLFYSGIHADLHPLSESGAPDVLVRGLACPDYASGGATNASAIWQALAELQGTNATNHSLAAILVRHSETATFVAKSEEESRLKESFQGGSLGEYLPHLLRNALYLHAAYASGNLYPALPTSNQEGPASPRSYAQTLTNALHQVLTLSQRKRIGELPATEIATMLLALEAGKVLAHSLEGGRWFRVSNSIHLNARAVLHSVVAYPKDYPFYSRERIRRALVYAARHSPFAPVRMPIGLDSTTCALRQWAEVILVLPHQLKESVEEIELSGLIREAHQRWSNEILPTAHTIVSDLSQISSATQSGLVFLPVTALVKLLRHSVTDRELARLSELSARVGPRQRRGGESAQTGEEGTNTSLHSERVFTPFDRSEITTLSKLHDIPESHLQEWSVLRNIIAPFGWLARRVGDYTVPESSVIFTVFTAPPRHGGANSHGLIGRNGLVPLRGSKCRECCDVDWTSSFPTFPRATMAETREQFEKQLNGIKDEIIEEAFPLPTPA